MFPQNSPFANALRGAPSTQVVSPQARSPQLAPTSAAPATPAALSQGVSIPNNAFTQNAQYAGAPQAAALRQGAPQRRPAPQRRQAAPRRLPAGESYKTLSEGANANLAGGRSVYGHNVTPGETWINPNFNPDQNANGYTRFDHSTRGSGLERAQTFDDGASLYDRYAGIASGQPGSEHSAKAVNWLNDQGIDPANATAEQKFDALDAAFRGAQKQNQKPPRRFPGASIIGPALGIAGGFFGGPLGAAAGSAVGSAINGGDASDMLRSGAQGAIGNRVGSHVLG